MRSLAAVLEVLLGLSLVFRLVPALVGRLIPAPFAVFAPGTAGNDYSLRGLLSTVILLTAVPLALRWWLHREHPRQVFGTAGLAGQLRLGTTALAFMLVLAALSFLLQPSMALDQARSLGLLSPAAFWVHGTVYAFIWSGYVEEFLYRGFATGAMQRSISGSWGLFLPVLLFSGWHFFNTDSLALAVAWVVTTLPASLAMTAVYAATGRIYGSWLAHAVNNATVGGLTAVLVYLPAWGSTAAAAVGAAALAWILLHRRDLAVLWTHVKSVFNGLHRQWFRGIGLLAVLAAGVWLHWQIPRGNLWLYLAHSAGLALLLLGVRWAGTFSRGAPSGPVATDG